MKLSLLNEATLADWQLTVKRKPGLLTDPIYLLKRLNKDGLGEGDLINLYQNSSLDPKTIDYHLKQVNLSKTRRYKDTSQRLAAPSSHLEDPEQQEQTVKCTFCKGDKPARGATLVGGGAWACKDCYANLSS